MTVTADLPESVRRWRDRGDMRLLAGRRVFTIDTGEPADPAGPPLVLLHGFPTCSFDWRHVIDDLAARHRVLALDFLGYGLSEKPDIAYPLGMQADLVSALLIDAGLEGQEIGLVTHDMGDSVGGEVQARALDGDLPATIIRRVVSNGSIYVHEAKPRPAQRLLLALGDRSVSIPGMHRIFAKGLPEVFGPDTQPDAEEMTAQWALLHADNGATRYPRLMRYYVERAEREHRWTGAIVAHPAPLTVLWGALDPVAGLVMVDRLRADVERGGHAPFALTVLDEVGHFPMIEAPGDFAAGVLAAMAS